MARTSPLRARLALAVLLVGAGAAALPAAASASLTPAPHAALDPALTAAAAGTPAVVQARPGATAAAAAGAARAGLTVGQPLAIIDGFAARGDAAGFAALAASPDVVAITLDREGHFTASSGAGSSSNGSSSSSPFTAVTGAQNAWANGYDGRGIGVAVLDTGVANTPDLSGRVVYGPDLSGEGTTIDSYGHGTVMAGIVAGNGAAARTAGMTDDRRGVAPGATIVSVKLAGRNGAVDVSTVLQGLHWVSAYKDQFDIRVLNLSYGTSSTQDPAVDPLDYAVERLWQQGILVVVAAGNSGPAAGSITKPGDDPLVLTVGAYDDKGDLAGDNDSVPAWSSQGPTAQGVAKPDLYAPGRTLVATRAYGSAVEQDNPKSLVSPAYIKGSGTSQATAVTSGLAALLVQVHPTWTPDQLKRALVSSVTTASGGPGRVHLPSANRTDPGPAQQQQPVATGLGSIEQSRGQGHVVTDCRLDGTPDVIQGEIDTRCEPWTGSAWTGSAWTGSAWTGSAWTGSAWTGSAWTGSAWTGSAWTGSAWTGSAWTGSAWTSAEYGELLTAFWGNHPSRWHKVKGENVDPDEPVGPPVQ